MKRYWHGPARGGKTGRLAGQLAAWIEAGVRPDRILVLAASRAQTQRFRHALAGLKHSGARGDPALGTFYGLVQRHVGLFFPLIAERAGFADPRREPVFIDVEAAQYLLNRIVGPRLAAFEEFKLFRPRLLGQLLDNAHKAALAGFELDEIAARLGAAWSGDARRLKAYEAAQDIAVAFRSECLKRNALDFSLQHHVFARHLLAEPAYARFVADRYQYVLADNIEELPPIAHDFLRQLLATCSDAIVAEDDPGGYRLFLGADPGAARALRTACDAVEAIDPPPEARRLAPFGRAISAQVGGLPAEPIAPEDRERVGLLQARAKYWVSMVQAVADAILGQVQAGVPASRIAVVAPYVEDVLRFELEERLRDAGIRVRALRPSRPLYDHPLTRALVTLARLGYPGLENAGGVNTHELARALVVAIDGLDLARAKTLAEASHRANAGRFDRVTDPKVWERVGMRFRERVESLTAWLANWRNQSGDAPPPLDVWWQTLFSEVLSRPGFGLAADREGANVVDKLFRSARVFRQALEDMALAPVVSIPADYLTLLAEGVMAAQFAPERRAGQDEDAVLLAPVYTYLTGDERSEVQIWLDVNATGWYDRLYQPLTHPYVLTRHWQALATRLGGPVQWTEEDEHRARQDMLRRVVGGLCDRCGDRLFLATSQLGLSGQEEAGALARALQRAL